MGTEGLPGRGYGRVVRPDDPRRAVRWTAEHVVQSLKDYERLFGNSTAASFSISSAKWQGRAELRERYIAGNPLRGEPWPSLNTIKKHFGGSFDDARRAAGLKPNKSGPNGRRPPGQEPIRDIRDRVLVLPPERTVVLERQLQANKGMLARARKHAEQLERELEASRRFNQSTRTVNAELRKENRALRERVRELKAAATQMVEELTA